MITTTENSKRVTVWFFDADGYRTVEMTRKEYAIYQIKMEPFF